MDIPVRLWRIDPVIWSATKTIITKQKRYILLLLKQNSMQWYSASQATQTQKDKIYTSNSFIIKSGLLYWKSHIETQMLPHRTRVITKWDGDYKWKRPNECKQRQNQQLYTKKQDLGQSNYWRYELREATEWEGVATRWPTEKTKWKRLISRLQFKVRNKKG